MITVTRSVTRLSNFTARGGRAIVVRIREGGNYLDFREKGRRQWHSLPVAQAFWEAVKNTAAEYKKRKKAEREAKRRERGML